MRTFSDLCRPTEQFHFFLKADIGIFPRDHSRESLLHLVYFEKIFYILSMWWFVNLLKPTGHVMHQQFDIQQLYVLPTLCLCVLYLSENKQRLVPLTA